jgi:hypothetical protein
MIHSDATYLEQARYFEVSGDYLYTVLHRVEEPEARVLLVGPFASERHNSYLPWVRWARYLAARGIEVLRYDYRGIGESGGAFEDMRFTDWQEDVQLLAEWLRSRSPALPLYLHGLELGALLAGRVFDGGTGDGLLLWSPPVDANQALRSTVARWTGLQQLFKCGEERRSVADCIRQFELEPAIEVDGYSWSSRLWADSFGFGMPAGLSSEERAAGAYERPVRILTLGKEAAPLVKGGSVGYDEAKDFDWLFAPNFEWIAGTPAAAGKGNQ